MSLTLGVCAAFPTAGAPHENHGKKYSKGEIQFTLNHEYASQLINIHKNFFKMYMQDLRGHSPSVGAAPSGLFRVTIFLIFVE